MYPYFSAEILKISCICCDLFNVWLHKIKLEKHRQYLFPYDIFSKPGDISYEAKGFECFYFTDFS
jgi:hypothetical protein